MSNKYVALQPILYAGRLHRPGDVIVCEDGEVAARWIAAGSVRGEDIPAPATQASTTPPTPIAPQPAGAPEPQEDSAPRKLGRAARKPRA